MQLRAWQLHKTMGLNGPDVCYVPLEEASVCCTNSVFTSLLSAYKAAVPSTALVPSEENTWHVKMFQAVLQQDAKLSSGEGQLVCKEASTLKCVYIYVSH